MPLGGLVKRSKPLGGLRGRQLAFRPIGVGGIDGLGQFAALHPQAAAPAAIRYHGTERIRRRMVVVLIRRTLAA